MLFDACNGDALRAQFLSLDNAASLVGVADAFKRETLSVVVSYG